MSRVGENKKRAHHKGLDGRQGGTHIIFQTRILYGAGPVPAVAAAGLLPRRAGHLGRHRFTVGRVLVVVVVDPLG